jgi:hypothetical protein
MRAFANVPPSRQTCAEELGASLEHDPHSLVLAKYSDFDPIKTNTHRTGIVPVIDMAIKMPRASGYVRRLARDHRRAEDNPLRGICYQRADDGYSNTRQHKERG